MDIWRNECGGGGGGDEPKIEEAVVEIEIEIFRI